MDKLKSMTKEERKEIFNAVQSQQNKDILDALEDAKKVIKDQRVRIKDQRVLMTFLASSRASKMSLFCWLCTMDTKKAEATGCGPMDQDKDDTPAVNNEKGVIDLLADMLKNHSLSSTDRQATSNSHVTPNISKRLALKAPETFRAGQDVRQWLVKIENHLELSGIYPEYQAKCAAQFLDNELLHTWQAESSVMRREGKAATFEEFKNCLMKYYCTKLQVRELRYQYENMKQTGSVIDFIRENKRLIHELADDETFAIGKGEAITKFLKHVKEPFRNYLYEHAPKPEVARA